MLLVNRPSARPERPWGGALVLLAACAFMAALALAMRLALGAAGDAEEEGLAVLRALDDLGRVPSALAAR